MDFRTEIKIESFDTLIYPGSKINMIGSCFANLLLEPIRKQMNENVVFLWRDKVKVLKSSLPGADAAVLGASALGWKD